MRKLVVALLVATCGTTAPAGARDYYFGVTYDPSLPLGETKDFAGDWSWLGLSLEGRKLIRPEASVGFLFAWHEMDKESNETISASQGVDAQAAHRRYVNSFPMMVNAHYYFGQLQLGFAGSCARRDVLELPRRHGLDVEGQLVPSLCASASTLERSTSTP